MCSRSSSNDHPKSSPSATWNDSSKALAPGFPGCCVGADDDGNERGNILAEYFRFAVGDRDGSGSRIDGERRVGFSGITVGTKYGP